MLLGLIVLLGATARAHDGDGDGIPDEEDRCPQFAAATQGDANRDGVGDDCQCGDANGNGLVDVSDIVAAQQMIAGKAEVSPLCDANGSGSCEASDVEAINSAIFGSCFPVCGRYPRPPEGKTACRGGAK
jgi:hypothetical protein